MTIKDCIMSGVTTITALSEPYYANYIATVDTEYVEPTNVKVKTVSYPMTKEDCEFTYRTYTKTNTGCRLGQYRDNTFYPIGSTIQIGTYSCTIVSYGQCERNRNCDNLYLVNIYVDTSTAIPTRRVTDTRLEDHVVKQLNSILTANDTIKNDLLYYDHNVVGLIGNTTADLIDATKIVDNMHMWQFVTDKGYQAQVNSVLDTTPIDPQEVITQINDYRKYYDFNLKVLKADYQEIESDYNSKSWISWLYSTAIAATHPNYDLFLLKSLSGTVLTEHTITFKVHKLTDGTVIIVLYTPVGYNYNIVVRLSPTSTIDQFNRLNPTFGVGKIAKNVELGTTVAVPFKTITALTNDEWGNLAMVFYNITHAPAETDFITYLNNAFETFINAGTEIPAFTGATFTRDTIASEFSRLGVLTIGTETIDI